MLQISARDDDTIVQQYRTERENQCLRPRFGRLDLGSALVRQKSSQRVTPAVPVLAFHHTPRTEGVRDLSQKNGGAGTDARLWGLGNQCW